MNENRFGGEWTRDKLDRLRGYLIAYRSIFATNERARFLATWYVDAFAGTGSISKTSPVSPGLLFGETELDQEKEEFLSGSARIALGLTSPFDHYLFIEQSRKKAGELNQVIETEFPALSQRTQVLTRDANEALHEWMGERNWNKERAVVFLDPYGMQVEWITVLSLAATQAVDLWYLFPFATRLLRTDQAMEESWSRRLDLLFGTGSWRERFYPVVSQETLFGPVETSRRDARESNIKDFIEERIRACFPFVADSLILRNSTGSPLYALCFAASNPKGAKTAGKIAQHLLRRG